MIIHLIVGLIKKHCIKWVNTFLNHMNLLKETNYATKTDLKNATGVDMSQLASKSDLASLKAEVDKIDVDKLKTVPVDLSKLSNVANNVVKKL